MPEVIQYTAYLNFHRDPATASDELMAKVIVSAKIDKACLGVGVKSGVAQLDFSITENEEWEEIKRICLETGGVEIIGIYPTELVADEQVKVAVKA